MAAVLLQASSSTALEHSSLKPLVLDENRAEDAAMYGPPHDLGPLETELPFNEPGLTRFSFNFRPFWDIVHIYGGGLIELGIEHTWTSGVLLGFDLAPAGASLWGAAWQVTARLRLGYSGEILALGFGAGSGFPWYWPQIGPFFRFGRYEGTYAEIWLYWLVPLIHYPVDAAFNLSVPTADRWRFKLSVVAKMLVYSAHLLLGGEYQLSGSGARTSVLNFGIGLTFFPPIPGPVLSIGYEKRF